MTANNKDKRTKEQLLQILSNALTQEEQLGERIKALETQLAACQQQQEDSRTEISEYGLSASKESFRIDYYKTTHPGRLKGIIEHLPTRQKKSFKGLGIKPISAFMERFLPANIQIEKVALIPQSIASRPPAKEADQQEQEIQAFLPGSTTTHVSLPILEGNIPLEEEAGQKSSFLERVRMQFTNPSPGVQPIEPIPAIPRHPELVVNRAGNNMPVWGQIPYNMPQPGKGSRLLERLRAEVKGKSSTT